MHQTAEQMCLFYITLSYQQVQPPGGTDIREAFIIAHLSLKKKQLSYLN